MEVTPEMNKKYKQDGLCPNCSDNYTIVLDHDEDWQRLRCETCKASWSEWYVLSHIDNIDLPEAPELTEEQKLKIELEQAKAEIAQLKAQGE